jgi:hypothetical protein
MAQLRMVGAQLAAIGRCALVGILAGTLATQAVAEGAATVSQQSPANAETANLSNGTQTEKTNPSTAANRPLEPQANTEPNALPDAPAASAGSSDSASMNMPLDMRGLMQDAAQSTASGQSTQAPTKPKHQIHPGWLAVSAVGVLFAAIGAVGLGGTRNQGLAVGFVVGGVALTGGGIYLTFR